MANASEIAMPANADYAGFWVRFGAVCIDLLLSAPLYHGLSYLAGPRGWAGEAVFTVLLILAYPLFFSSRWQGSPGMYLFNIRITDAVGNRISFMRGLNWILTSLVVWLLCFAGVLYLQSRFDLIGIAQLELSCFQQNVAFEDCAHEIESAAGISFASFSALVDAALGLFVFLTFIWALSIALPKDKTGFHNLICGTRFLKGRPVLA